MIALLLRPGSPLGRQIPVRGLWVILLAAWAARVAVGLIGDQALHPDEIFQYLEPAHGIVFGAQMVSWEFIFGGRSYLIPGFVAAVLWTADTLGFGEPEYYIPAVKIAFCTLSMLLPISMHRIARNMWGAETAAVALLLGCFWYEFVGFAHKPLSGLLAAYFGFAALALATDQSRSYANLISATLLLALAFVTRYHSALLFAPFALVVLLDLDLRRGLAFAGATLCSLILVGLIDHFTWGSFFHSILLNLEANLMIDYIWQIVPAWSFLVWIGIASLGAAWGALALAIFWRPRRYLLFLALIAIFFVSHAFPAHKEYRFALPWVPLWLMIAADLAVQARSAGWLGRLHTRASSAACIAPLALASILGISNLLPHQPVIYDPSLSTVINDPRFSKFSNPPFRFFHRDPALQAYIDLGNDEELEALLESSKPLVYSGGYYYLHKAVPLYNVEILAVAQQSAVGQGELNRWVTHILAEPRSDLDVERLFEKVEDTGHYSLWRVRPDRGSQAHRWESYRISLHANWFHAPPLLLRHLPKGADFSPRIIRADRAGD